MHRDPAAGAAEPAGADDAFAAIMRALASRKGVTLGSGRRGFGSDALQVDGRIFAMARRGGLVVKLPRDRVAELIATSVGVAFDAGKGRPMREWLVLSPDAVERWLELATEALAFVSDHPGAPTRAGRQERAGGR